MSTRLVRVHVVQKVVPEAAVAVTRIRLGSRGIAYGLFLWLACLTADAAILPEDRADFMYHSYDGVC